MTKDPPTERRKAERAPSVAAEVHDPLDIADDIKGLFLREGVGEFDRFFDLAYPHVVQLGGASVIARDDDGKLIMHVGVFPRAFRHGDAELRGGLLGDLLVARPHRDFWSALGFFRQAVGLLAERGFDFLYTDPTETSFAVVRAGGFDVLGSLRRHVLPLVPGWLSVLRLRAPVTDLTAVQVPWREGAERLLDQRALMSAGAFRAVRSTLFYESRAWAQVTDQSEWIVLERPGSNAGSPVALILTTPFVSHRTLGLMDLLWDEHHVNLESVLYAAATQARALGFRKLGIRVLDQCSLGETVRRCGFIARNDEQPVLVKSLKKGLEIPPPEEWLLTWIDGSTW